MNKYQATHFTHQHTSTKRLLAAALLCAGAFCFAPAQAEDRHDHSAPENGEQDEVQWQLPAAPLPENLLPFYTSTFTGQSFAVDAKSVTIEKDHVVRYTIVATSRGGARNVSYEGIRCATMERKLFAFGHADGTWGKARDPQWEPIPSKAANLQQFNLAQDFFCKDSLVPGKTGHILEDLRYHTDRNQPGQL